MVAPSLPSPSGTSIRSGRHVPLLSLAPPALALGEALAVGEPGEDNNVGEIWNVITRAADLVKDGERLENLAWRHWGQPRRNSSPPVGGAPPTFSADRDADRRLSMSSQGSASSASLHTPVESSSYLPRPERRTFGGALKLLLEKDEDNFKDWVEGARRDRAASSPGAGVGLGIGLRAGGGVRARPGEARPREGRPGEAMPTLSVPDTPVANHVEIRLVEPTPVPSRDGSLGTSINASGLIMAGRDVSTALPLREVVEETDEGRTGSEKKKGKLASASASAHARAQAQPQAGMQASSQSRRTQGHGLAGPAQIQTSGISRARSSSPKRKGKFFVQSSPGKGSGSDSSHLSPVAAEVAPQALPADLSAAYATAATASNPATATNTATTTPTPASVSKLPPPSAPTAPSAPAAPAATMAKPPPMPRRRSSDDSSGAHHKPAAHQSQKRHISLTAMRSKFHAEKRRVADAIVKKDERESTAKAQAQAKHDHTVGENEESGWEDEDEEEDGEEEDEEDEDEEDEDEDEDWSDEDGEGGEDGEENKDGEDGEDGEDDEWEEEEGEEGDDSAVVAEPERIISPSPERAGSRAKDLSRRRSSSRPTRPSRKAASTADLTALLARRISWHGDRDATTGDAGNGNTGNAKTTPAKNAPPPPAPTPLAKMSKKERQAAAAERAKIEARLDAQRKREMFAKQQIFGKGPTQGLLASALQRGASMVNLPSAAQGAPLRPSPTHGQLTSLAQSPRQVPSLLRSKSAVAMPVQTGVSVTIPPHAGHIAKAAAKHAHSSSPEAQERTKATVELESDESEDDDSNYLNTTLTRQKIADMAVRREAKEKAKAAQAQAQNSAEGLAAVGVVEGVTAGVGAASAVVGADGAAGPSLQQAAPVVPLALPVHRRVNEYGVVQPMTPTTRRRNIIMAEMSESLRRNVVLEREKSSGGLSRVLSSGAAPRARPPPSTHLSMYPSHRSAINLTQYAQSQPLERHSSHDPSRTPFNSHNPHHTPYGAAADAVAGGGGGGGGAMQPHAGSGYGSHPHAQGQAPSQQHVPARRPQPSVLSGGIRPLTRVGNVSSAGLAGGPGRTQSSIALGATTSASSSTAAPGSVGAEGASVALSETDGAAASSAAGQSQRATPMVRWASSGGEGTTREKERKEWSRRSALDTSYRSHGW